MATEYFIDNGWKINTDGRGRRINTAVVMLLTPIFGALFLMFLPFIGFYLFAEAIIVKASHVVLPLFSYNMTVGEAHLTGNKTDAKIENVESDALEELSKEIASRRK